MSQLSGVAGQGVEAGEAGTGVHGKTCELGDEDERASKRTHVTISAANFYGTFSGHDVEDLTVAYESLRREHRSIIFLAGDSSLDNKFWFRETAHALNGYEDFLSPATMKQDVCYWLNKEAVGRGAVHVACLNTAVEATALASRTRSVLPSDRFIRDHITAEDYLIVSVGGNDIALRPSFCTILNLIMLLRCNSSRTLAKFSCGCLPFAG